MRKLHSSAAPIPRRPLAVSVSLSLALLGSLPLAHAAQDGASPQPAPASESKPASKPAVTIDKVEVRGDAELVRQNTSTFKQVVGQGELTRFGDSSVVDVLGRQPGVVVTRTANGSSSIRMRGLGGGYVRILVDGEPAPANFDLDNLSPELVERIEIMQVPSVALGTQAVAGTINIILKQGRSRRQRQGTVSLTERNGAWSKAASATLGDGNAQRNWLLSASLNSNRSQSRLQSDTQGEDLAGPAHRIAVDRTASTGVWGNLAPRVDWKLADGDKLGWQAWLWSSRNNRRIDRETAYLAGAASPWGQSANDFDTDYSGHHNLVSWEHNLAQGRKLDLKATLGQVGWNSTNHIRYLDGAGQASHAEYQHNQGRVAYGSLAPSYTAPLGEHHKLVAGSELKASQSSNDAVDTLDGLSKIDLSGRRSAIRQHRYALYAQDEWEIDPRHAATLGLRWERYAVISGSDVAETVRASHGVLTPVMQIAWKLPGSDKDQAKLALSRTWREPDANANAYSAIRNLSQNNSFDDPDTTGNPHLRPELAWALDLSLEHYPQAGGVATGSVFAKRIDDVIVTTKSLESGRWVSRPENASHADVLGIEIDLKGKLTQLIAEAPGVNLRVNLVRYWSQVSGVPGPNNRLGSQTPMSFTLSGDYALPGSALSLGSSYTYVKKGEVRLSEYESSHNPPQRNLEAYAVYKYSPTAQLRTVLGNLLADDSREESRYIAPGSWQRSVATSPGHRFVRLTLELKL